jgi:hypothetical protein
VAPVDRTIVADVNPPPPPVWTGPVILTLCIALLSLLLAGIALGWQVVSWRRSGPRVKVSAGWGFYSTGAGLIFITATNSGRLGTEIGSCGFDLPDDRQIVDPDVQLPTTELAPGGSVSVRFNPDRLRIPLAEQAVTGKGVRPWVQTGHGRIRGKRVHLGELIEMAQRATSRRG